jgi:hypothetical protein
LYKKINTSNLEKNKIMATGISKATSKVPGTEFRGNTEPGNNVYDNRMYSTDGVLLPYKLFISKQFKT